MSEQKKLIDEIKNRALEFKNDVKYKDKYEEYENMKQTLSDNLYSKNSHFIYELIQNAEDNTYSEKVNPKIKFIIDDNGILTQNNEIGFNKENIESICKFSSSSKKGNKELGFIGEKGLGFKSVFAVSSNPAIYSNSYHFYFLEGEYTIPYWIEEDDFKNYPSEFLKKDSTNIYLKFKKDFLYKDDIKKKISEIEPIIILFLKKLSNIEIYQKNKQIIDVSKKLMKSSIKEFKEIQLKYDKFEDIYYLTNKIISKPKDIDEPKREKVLNREIVIAFPSFDNKEKEDRVFSFLPTEIHTGLPFLIQSDFILIGNRENIIEDNRWNLWLMDEIVEFFVEEFEKLRELDKYKYLRYLDKEKSKNIFIDKYYQQILEKLQEKDLFLSVDEKFVNVSNLAILEDFDFMFEYLKDIKYVNQNKKIYSFLNEQFFIPKHIVKNWNINKVDKKEFLRIIGNSNKSFSKKFKENNLLFENILKYIGNDFENKNILENLPIIPIDDENKNIIFYSFEELKDYQIFFKLDEDGILNNIFANSKVISKKYKKQLETIKFYSSIFKIKHPNISDILESLSPNFYENIENNVNLLVYIKDNYKTDEINIINSLAKNFKFLTKNNYIIPHKYNEGYSWRNEGITFSTEMYISKEYIASENCIENLVEKYCTNDGKKNIDFISDKYLEQDKKNSEKDIKTLKNDWNEFFSKLKINDELKLERFELEMYAYDSKSIRRRAVVNIDNIGFLSTPTFDSWNSNSTFIRNFNLQKLNYEDSIFLFNKFKLLKLNYLEYRRVTGFYRDFEYIWSTIPLKSFIESDFPIYINNQKFKIKDVYLNVDEKLKNFFNVLPTEYKFEDKENLLKIFNIKEAPTLDELVNLIIERKLEKFEDIKSTFKYIHYKWENKKIEINDIPILKKEKIEYVKKDKLIWKDGKELGLIEVESSYGDDFKKFFTEQINIPIKPTIEQYIEYLKTNPKNYKNAFNKFIVLLSENEYYEIEDEKIVFIKDKAFSFEEIIINDEFIENNEHINNLLNFEKRNESFYKEISEKYNLQNISEFEREYKVSNSINNGDILDIYLKLLHFVWDYIYSKNAKYFEQLKTDKDFILETKNIKNGAFADIVLRIYIKEQYIDVDTNFAIKDETIYLSKKVDERNKIKEVSKFIANKLEKVEPNILERFYDKVYKYNEFSKDEYYKDEGITSPENNEDKFDTIFDKLKNEELNLEVYHNDKIQEESLSEDFEEKLDLKNEIKKPILNISSQQKLKNIEHSDDNKSIDNLKPVIQKEKTICPECNIELNKKNLEKHLQKVHNKTIENFKSPNIVDAIQNHNKPIEKKDEELDPSIIIDENKFLEKIQQKLKENLEKVNPEIKKTYSNIKVKIGKDETKSFLEREYKGHCQICGFTFDKKNHQGKYFELFDWLSEKITKEKSNVINAGSSLCLCSKCHSIMKYGDFGSKFINNLQNNQSVLDNYTFKVFCDVTIKQTENIEVPEKFEFSMDYKIPIRLLNEDRCIFYTQEHFLHFYNILTLR
ncbi:sacsin N-terminal ATP-binding-like domain-containing protein [Aliarcobacter butzleri]|uniref:sacsin N-terminal ATP-binding-like domain-containing protein n=1 Tax=Aliarcobacter butzleri TaxID=28197 RepID=UPI002B240538|nr:hypothetical protein [Aliarcobacter butzleri]